MAAVTRVDGPTGRFYSIDGADAPYPSVTHVLACIAKPALISWAANQERALVMDAAANLWVDLNRGVLADCAQSMVMPDRSRAMFIARLQGRIGTHKAHAKQLAKAGEIGSQAHALIEWDVRRQMGQAVGPEPLATDAAQWAFMAFQDWAKSVNLKPLLIEQVVYSRTHRYAGTMDLLAEVNDVITLVDVKTSKGVYPEYFLQVAAYAKALDEMGHGQPAQGVIVRLPKVETDPAFEVVPCPPFGTLFPTFIAVRKLWEWTHAQELAYQARRKAALV